MTTDDELATLARQCHEYMAPHDSPTHYNDEGLCDQCVVIVRWFADAVLPDHDRQLLEALASDLSMTSCPEWVVDAILRRARPAAALAAPVEQETDQ